MSKQVTKFDERGSVTAAWLKADIAMSQDGGHSYEYRDGLHTIDGVASFTSYRSARELMADAS